MDPAQQPQLTGPGGSGERAAPGPDMQSQLSILMEMITTLQTNMTDFRTEMSSVRMDVSSVRNDVSSVSARQESQEKFLMTQMQPGQAPTHPLPNPNPMSTPNPPMNPSFAPALDITQDYNRLGRVKRNLMEFDITKHRWHVYIKHFCELVQSEGYDLNMPGLDKMMKGALYSKLGYKAVLLAGDYTPSSPGVVNMSFRQYIDALGSIYSPPSGTMQTREEIKNRKQGKTEPYLVYLHEKEQLYKLAYVDIYDWQTLRLEAIMGLANPEVRADMYKAGVNTYPELTQRVGELVTAMQQRIKNGDSLDSSWDGLNIGFTETVSTKKKAYEVNAVGGSNLDPTAQPVRTNRPQCWDCGSTSHFHNSPACPTPGTRKFGGRVQGQGRGGRGNGSRRGRGAGGRGSGGSGGRWMRARKFTRADGGQGQVHTVEAEQDFMVWVEDEPYGAEAADTTQAEDHFLGETANPQATP